jgi:amino acid transporter
MSTPRLHRHIGLGALVVYGVGDILGAGIYGLVGKAAGEMGNAVWIAFVTSMIAAGLTGLSYASLGSRYPKAGGASYFTHRAFKKNFLAYVVGLTTLASGITSMATSSRAFSGYFSGLVGGSLPLELIVVGFCLVVASVVIRGIRESMWMNLVCTSIEVGGLLLVLFTGLRFLGSVDHLSAVTPSNPSGELSVSLVLSGAVLTFFSFVGFEDMINVAEEVKDPERNLPRAILMAVALSSLIYVGISLVAVSVIPATELAASSSPLVDVVKKSAPWFPPTAFSFIAMFAVANTALLNFVMGSRLIYGMAGQALLPRFLGHVSPRTHTPLRATLVLLVILLVLALSGDISSLGRATSILLLACFFCVNLSLIVLKSRKNEPRGRLEVPYFVPILGAAICGALLAFAKREELVVAGSLLAGIVVLYFVLRPSGGAIEALES